MRNKRKCCSLLTILALLLPLTMCVSVPCKAADDKPVDAPKAAPPAEPPLNITTNDQGISVYAVGVQADEVFTKLARATGVGVIIDDTVGRRDNGAFTSRLITINLTNKKLTDIIEKICTAYGLSYSQVGGVFMISEGIPKNPSSYLMSDIDSVTTEYVLSSRAKSLLPVFLQDHVKVNEGQNAVILSAPKDVLTKFREDIKQFDVPAEQIMIDVMMVEMTDSAAKELGFDWLWNNAGKSAEILSGSGDLLYRSFGHLTKEFTVRLNALIENGQARVKANPRIATMSGQPASIFVGRQRYLSQSVNNTNYIDAGISLDMTPWTGGEGEIIAEIHPQVSVMSAPDPITRLPEKSTRQANTVVRVKDGDTIIIGGLTQTEKTNTRSRIPVLGNLPLVGWLFAKSERSEAQTEMVFFITPRIMSQTGHLKPEREKELLAPLGLDAGKAGQ
jgi:hypothetical protein